MESLILVDLVGPLLLFSHILRSPWPS